MLPGSGARELAAELGAQRLELLREPLVAPVDQADATHRGCALRREGSDQVAEPTAQVGDLDVRGAQRRRSGDHRRVVEVALPEPARPATQALLVDLDR